MHMDVSQAVKLQLQAAIAPCIPFATGQHGRAKRTPSFCSRSPAPKKSQVQKMLTSEAHLNQDGERRKDD